MNGDLIRFECEGEFFPRLSADHIRLCSDHTCRYSGAMFTLQCEHVAAGGAEERSRIYSSTANILYERI